VAAQSFFDHIRLRFKSKTKSIVRHRHDFDHFIDEPPPIAQGGKGVVVPGCPMCKKRINTMSQFLDHLADDVMPALIEKLSVDAKED
jgi:hypothetical protein